MTPRDRAAKLQRLGELIVDGVDSLRSVIDPETAAFGLALVTRGDRTHEAVALCQELSAHAGGRPAEPLPTPITPEQTVREAERPRGVSSRRWSTYNRRMNAVLAGREGRS